MIDVKEAVKIAVDYLQNLDDYLQNLNDSTELKDLLLEEVALSDDEKYWYVTLGFSRPVEVNSHYQLYWVSQNIKRNTNGYIRYSKSIQPQVKSDR